MGRVSGGIALFVGDHLHRARFPAPSFFVAAHDPQIAGVEDDAIFRSGGGRLYFGAAGLIDADGSLGLSIGVGGHIGGGSASGLGFSVGVLVRNQLEVHAGLYRVVIVVHRGYVKERGVAGADGVAHRLDADAEGAAGGEKASAAGDLAVGLVGDGGLHGVVLVHRADSGWLGTAWGR